MLPKPRSRPLPHRRLLSSYCCRCSAAQDPTTPNRFQPFSTNAAQGHRRRRTDSRSLLEKPRNATPHQARRKSTGKVDALSLFKREVRTPMGNWGAGGGVRSRQQKDTSQEEGRVPSHSKTTQEPPTETAAEAPNANLFDQLFPNLRQDTEAAETSAEGAEKAAAASREGNLWKTELDQDALRAWLKAQPSNNDIHGDEDEGVLPLESQPTMLILSNASKSLVESDLFSLGRKSIPSITSWQQLPREVIQAHDRSTLEPLGLYFLVFSSRTAARRYQQKAERLHFQGRTASRGTSSLGSQNPKADKESFTLTGPGDAPLSLSLYGFSDAVSKRLSNFAFRQILASNRREVPRTATTSRKEKLVQQDAQFGATDEAQTRTVHHVVVHLDQGAITLEEMMGAIRKDDEQRAWSWNVAAIQRYQAQPEKSAVGLAPSRSSQKQRAKRGDVEKDDGEEHEPTVVRQEQQAEQGAQEDEGAKKCGRWVVSFEDLTEAHRFARTWHRVVLAFDGVHQNTAEPRGDALKHYVVNTMMPWGADTVAC